MTHDHVHTHPSTQDAEPVHGPTGPATVMADIGGDTGAAVVYTPGELVGQELEIRRVGHAWDGTHTAVRERHVGSTTLWAGFFGALDAGEYEVRLRDDASRAMGVEIVGGTVTETSW